MNLGRRADYKQRTDSLLLFLSCLWPASADFAHLVDDMAEGEDQVSSYETLMQQFPWLAGFCCAPRSKEPLLESGGYPQENRQWPRAEDEALNEEERALAAAAGNGSTLDEEAPELKSEPPSEPNSGCDTDPTEEPGAEMFTDPSLEANAQSMPSGMRTGANTVRELEHLEALLVSDEIGQVAKQGLLDYAALPEGRAACIELLSTQVTAGPTPLSLMPDAFAAIQELMGQLMLDAMQREASDDLRRLIAVSHAITLVSCGECEPCEE